MNLWTNVKWFLGKTLWLFHSDSNSHHACSTRPWGSNSISIESIRTGVDRCWMESIQKAFAWKTNWHHQFVLQHENRLNIIQTIPIKHDPDALDADWIRSPLHNAFWTIFIPISMRWFALFCAWMCHCCGRTYTCFCEKRCDFSSGPSHCLHPPCLYVPTRFQYISTLLENSK